MFFLQNCKKKKMEIFVFCHITFEPIRIWTCSAPQNDRLNLSFVKDIRVNLARNELLSVANFGQQSLDFNAHSKVQMLKGL